jgi:hypothetical protein
MGDDQGRALVGGEATGATQTPPPGYAPIATASLSRDSWVRIFLWIVPIVFTAGSLFVSVKSMTQRQDEQEQTLREQDQRMTRIETDQRIMQSTVQAMSAQQEKLVGRVEAIVDKLNEQHAALSAIGERIGARVAQSYGNGGG